MSPEWVTKVSQSPRRARTSYVFLDLAERNDRRSHDFCFYGVLCGNGPQNHGARRNLHVVTNLNARFEVDAHAHLDATSDLNHSST